MAEHKIEAGQKGCYGNSLVAETVDTVKVEGNCDAVEVTNASGSKAIYFTTDGSAPTVHGPTTHELPAAISSRKVTVRTNADETATVKLISEGAPAYSVARSRALHYNDLTF